MSSDLDFGTDDVYDDEVHIIKSYELPQSSPARKPGKTRGESRDDAVGIKRTSDGARILDIKEFDMNKNLHPFGPDDVKWGSKIFIIGKPGTGKSEITKSIMLHKAWIFPAVQVFSGS